MARANQPTYDFLAGGEPSPPARQTSREAVKQPPASRVDVATEELRAQLRATQYELDSLKQERELLELQHQQDLHDLQARAENDFKRAQAAEATSNITKKKAETLARDFQDVRDRAENEKAAFEKKIRDLRDDAQGLREELEEAKTDLASNDRQSKYAYNELEQKYNTLQASVEDVQQDLSGRVNALQNAQQRVKEVEAQKGELENEVLRLKAQTGDSETLALIKKELSEQVAYIKKLEVTNREHVAEIKKFRKVQKSLDVVEEEKRTLEARVRMMDDLRKELSEAQLQRRILEDEKTGWTSYLQSEVAGGGELQYDTPEQMAKAFMQERLERLSLVDKLGTIQPELAVREESIRSLEQEKAHLQVELGKLRSSDTRASVPTLGDDKARMRLERQKSLATKEVEYLRAKLRSFEAEEQEFAPEELEEERNQQSRDLEGLVEQYRSEVQTLQSDISKLELQPDTSQSSKKRPREDDQVDDERLGELQRKSRSLQDQLDKLQSRNLALESELKASLSHVNSLKESSRTRVLELRNNPTAEAEAIKMSAIRTLRDENAALLAQLEGRPGGGVKVVPISTVDNLRQQMEEVQAQRAQVDKKTLRLKQIWSTKSLEFREAVASILGWKLDFQPNGRVKATSILYPTSFVNGEQEENSIVFDGENGTMKVSGGPRSMFAGEIKPQIEFWVEGRKEIPCFLAACTLEFYDRTTRAQKI